MSPLETAMATAQQTASMYEGEGDRLMSEPDHVGVDHITLLPDARPSKTPDRQSRIRIMWGQHLLEDLLSDRYRTLICSVNAEDNSRGIITQLATLLPTSQWDANSITAHAQRFTHEGDSAGHVKVLKFDMDTLEVLALLRPAGQPTFRIQDLSQGFAIVAEMLRRKPGRLPSASVSFLGANANALRDEKDTEPSFERVLNTMYESGYNGDIYPAPWMWEAAPIGVFARYPFPESLERMREGGF